MNLPNSQADAGPLRRQRDYRLWWLGNLASSSGDQLMVVAVPLMVLLLTGSPLQTGLVASIEVVPFILLSLPAGELVDRLPRRTLLMWSSVISALAYSSIVIAYAVDALTMAQLYVVAFVSGCAAVFFFVAQQASLPRVVDEHQLGAASGQAEAVERLAAILGPPAATVLFYQANPAAPFAINALSFVVVAVTVTRIRRNLGPAGADQLEPPRRQPLQLLAGARSVVGNALLRDLTFLNAAGDILFAGIGLLMIMLLREHGEAGPAIGLVFSAAAVGGLLGALATNRLETRIGLPTAVIGKHILTAAIFPLLLLNLPLYVVAAVWASISFQVSIVAVIQRKYLMRYTPAGLMGRAQSFTTLLSFGGLPLGTAATGFLLDGFGATGTTVTYSVVLALLALGSAISPAIRAGATPPVQSPPPVKEP